jgi:hypothetical protein
MKRKDFKGQMKALNIRVKISALEFNKISRVAKRFVLEIKKLKGKYQYDDKLTISFNNPDKNLYFHMFRDFIAFAEKNTIRFNPAYLEAKGLLSTLRHEFCHILQYKLSLEDKLKANVRKEDLKYCVSEYAKINYAEMQAEAFQLYEGGKINKKVKYSLKSLI